MIVITNDHTYNKLKLIGRNIHSLLIGMSDYRILINLHVLINNNDIQLPY